MRNTIDMAREAGAIHIHERPKEFALVGNNTLQAFEALVRADEREACADLCYQLVNNSRETRFAAAIRARGNT
jgi:hypothetical protein